MSFTTGQKFQVRYDYDFSKQGGAIGAITLAQVAGNVLNTNCRVIGASVLVSTTLTSGATPTLTLGPTSTPAGYFADIWAKLTGTAKAVLAGNVAGALIWDDTNDVAIPFLPALTADQDLKLTIGTAALTGGKFSVFLECIAL